MNTIYVKQRTGCCSIVLWDMIMIIFMIANLPSLLPDIFFADWHVGYRILLGIGAGIIFFVFCSIRYIGILFQIAAAAFWTYLISGMILINFDFYNSDATWRRVCHILLFLVFLALHWEEISVLASSVPHNSPGNQQAAAPEVTFNEYNDYYVHPISEQQHTATVPIVDPEPVSDQTAPLSSAEEQHNFEYIPTPYASDFEFLNMKKDIWGDFTKRAVQQPLKNVLKKRI